MTPLPTPVRVLATWLAILPVALLAQLALSPLLGGAPAPLATVVVVTIAVPIAALWTVPLAMRLAARARRTPAGVPATRATAAAARPSCACAGGDR